MTEELPAWRSSRERGNRWVLRFMKWMALHAPDWVVAPLIWAIAFYFTLLPGRDVLSGTRRYLGIILGRDPRFADRHRQVLTFAHVILDRVRLLASRPRGFRINAVGEGVVERYHLSGRGGVLLGAHFGSFEAMRAFDRSLPGLKVRYLMFQENAAMSAELLNAINPDVAAQVIDVKDGQSAMLAVRDALDTGQFVAFLGDRMPSHSERGALPVDFLGHMIQVPRAPYLSAIMAQVPLILCFAPRTGLRTYDIVFTELYDGAPVPRAERDRMCSDLAQTYANALADMCRRHPYNWFNFFDIWR